MNNNFYTLTTYIHNKNKITYPMEDYLEMIYRKKKEKITITSLSHDLNIKKSSCSKMIHKLKDLNLIKIEENQIRLTKIGSKIAGYLYHRHQVLEHFLKNLNQENFELAQVEKLEHFIDEVTLRNLEKLTNQIIKQNGS